MTITIIQMFEQGLIFHLIAMLILFVLMVIMISRIGGQKAAVKDAQSVSSQAQKPGNIPVLTGLETTAAIAAAVNQYKKNNKI